MFAVAFFATLAATAPPQCSHDAVKQALDNFIRCVETSEMDYCHKYSLDPNNFVFYADMKLAFNGSGALIPSPGHFFPGRTLKYSVRTTWVSEACEMASEEHLVTSTWANGTTTASPAVQMWKISVVNDSYKLKELREAFIPVI